MIVCVVAVVMTMFSVCVSLMPMTMPFFGEFHLIAMGMISMPNTERYLKFMGFR